MKQDIRWHQRLNNYTKALAQLSAAVLLAQSRPLSLLEKQGLIQGFEFTHELAWNVIKDYLFFQGQSNITGSRDATREAFNKNLITQGEVWMEMIKSRNQTSHTYNQIVADEIVDQILKQYYPCFKDFLKTMHDLKKNNEQN
ncbi:MAG: nucleotidyltransferase [Legionellales bacterium RIFCSPHIGHO2_12_FULL_37_14]|nr:MAG: nucleotidyltransferase [Legionellales bacterium RIFCSPHIGHO2_12_FULL_37_14]